MLQTFSEPSEPPHPRSRRSLDLSPPGRGEKARAPRNDGGNVKHLVRIVCAVAFALTVGRASAADQSTIDAAKKEGQVVWYTTLIVNQIIRPLKTAFEKKYPG